ncbi:hypothetical protein ANANG_G00311110 [Anguilla anguilla]|uniref:Uncharacterized protein n=1 Tax=Anguilla anguilla TaxID=7936 RepID=A0A9D3LJD3_ANGAN|nr:hypothetical protein ANANG_G00311110 [Anguilla anguilla]
MNRRAQCEHTPTAQRRCDEPLAEGRQESSELIPADPVLRHLGPGLLYQQQDVLGELAHRPRPAGLRQAYLAALSATTGASGGTPLIPARFRHSTSASSLPRRRDQGEREREVLAVTRSSRAFGPVVEGNQNS